MKADCGLIKPRVETEVMSCIKWRANESYLIIICVVTLPPIPASFARK